MAFANLNKDVYALANELMGSTGCSGSYEMIRPETVVAALETMQKVVPAQPERSSSQLIEPIWAERE